MKRSVVPRDHGLSLIELVVAMAVFALVAVMGVQALTGMLRTRDHLSGIASQTDQISHATALLRHDLNAVVPAVFFPPETEPPQSPLRLSGNSTRLSLSVAGQPDLGVGPARGQMQRVEWQFDPATSTLTRARWSTLTPVDVSARSIDTTVLEGVEALTARSYWPDTGWSEGLRPPNGGQVANDDDAAATLGIATSGKLPLAVEITLRTRDFGDVPLVQALQ